MTEPQRCCAVLHAVQVPKQPPAANQRLHRAAPRLCKMLAGGPGAPAAAQRHLDAALSPKDPKPLVKRCMADHAGCLTAVLGDRPIVLLVLHQCLQVGWLPLPAAR